MKPWFRILGVGLISGCLLVSSTGAATPLEQIDDRLARKSTLVVTGRCTHVDVEWRSGGLFTVATVDVDDVLQGEPTDSVRVLIPGGIDLDREPPVAMTWPAAPTTVPNERVLLFLVPSLDGGGEYFVTGFSQGKLSLTMSEAGRGTVISTK